jgi:predicted MFS family arabinose efflux permease
VEEKSAPPSWLVLLLAAACGVTVANLYYAQPLLALLRKDFHVGPAAAGALITVTQLGYASGMVLLVPLGDRLENRRLVTVLLSITTIGTAIAATAQAYAALLVSCMVIGTTAVVAQILLPYAADLATDETRGRVVGKVFSGLLTGILLSRVVSSLLAQVTSWRVVYVGSAVLMAALVLTLGVVLPPRQPTTGVRYGRLLASTAAMVRQHAVLRRRALYQSAMFGAFSAFWTTISFLLTGPLYDYSQLDIAVFALVGAGGAAVAPLAGRWADRGIAHRMNALALALAAGAFLLAGVGRHHIMLLVVAAVVLDGAVQTTVILGQHRIYQLDPTARARLNSVYVATFFVGGAAGSQIGSILYHSGGWTAVTTFGTALPVAAFLLWLKPERD